MKLVKTADYLLLIDEEAEIKGTTCLCYNSIKNTWGDDIILYQGSMPEYHYKGFQKIVAYYPLTKEVKELDLPLLPNPFEEGVDVEMLADVFSTSDKVHPADSYISKVSYIEGYKAARFKQFSFTQQELEELLLRTIRYPRYFGDDIPQEKVKKIIQSLSIQQLPKEFIPEYKEVTCGCDSITHNVIKIITNSENKKELVGTYKY